jgi:hypothetical protein
MLFKPEVRPGRQPAPKLDPLFGHGDPDAIAATPAGGDEPQKPMSPKEKKESARKKKEQVSGDAR